MKRRTGRESSRRLGSGETEIPRFARNDTRVGGARKSESRESSEAEWGDVEIGLGACDHVCHDFCGDGGEEDAVAEVAGSDEVAGGGSCAEDGQGVWRTGTQAGPVSENSCVAKLWDEFERGFVQAQNCGGVGALVESGFFHRGADKQAAIAPRNEI